MSEDINIDELLNGFIDDQLSPRQRTQINRLTAHDPEIAKRLDQLRKCKILVASLPSEEAPPYMTEQITAALKRRAVLPKQQLDFDQRAGARHLMLRKVLTVAAMIGLVAVLAAVIYTIVGPQSTPKKLVVSDDWTRPETTPAVMPAADEKPLAHLTVPLLPTGGQTQFNGRLELKTNDLIAVNAVIKRAIEDNGLVEYTGPANQAGKNIYLLTCTQNALASMLVDLENIWTRIESATLFVETGRPDGRIVVDAVNPRQIIKIARQPTLQSGIDLAKNLAVLNNINELLPGRELLIAVEDKEPVLLTIPKPVLTSNHRIIRKPIEKPRDGQKLYLTIVLTPNR